MIDSNKGCRERAKAVITAISQRSDPGPTSVERVADEVIEISSCMSLARRESVIYAVKVSLIGLVNSEEIRVIDYLGVERGNPWLVDTNRNICITDNLGN